MSTIVGWVPGPTVERRREVDKVRWCFRCRRRLRHVAVLLDYDRESYYEPVWVLRCAGCGEDHSDFPGTGGHL